MATRQHCASREDTGGCRRQGADAPEILCLERGSSWGRARVQLVLKCASFQARYTSIHKPPASCLPAGCTSRCPPRNSFLAPVGGHRSVRARIMSDWQRARFGDRPVKCLLGELPLSEDPAPWLPDCTTSIQPMADSAPVGDSPQPAPNRFSDVYARTVRWRTR